jgi:hypothetical protein
MKKIDWNKDYLTKGMPVAADPRDNKRTFQDVNAVFKDLLTLRSGGKPEDHKAHDMLVYRYLYGHP